MTEEKSLTYKEAMARIEEIVDIVENQEPDVDQLASLVKEGTLLISRCKEKLRNTEAELNSSLDQLEQKD